MSDFPRGWTLSVATIGSAASITVAAIAGVVHVLDAVDAILINTTVTDGPDQITLSSSDGVFSSMTLGRVYLPAAGKDELSVSNLNLAAGPGASLTIAFNGAIAGSNESLVIQGHDI